LSVAYSPDGQHIVSGSDDNTVIIWDARTGKVISGPLKGHTGSIFSVAYSPNGKHIVSGSDDTTICVWDAETGQLVSGPLKGHKGSVFSVAYSLDGKHFVSGSLDNSISVWDADPGGLLDEHNGSVSSVTYSPDGKHTTSHSNQEIPHIHMVIKPKCHHQYHSTLPTGQPHCWGCTWGFTDNSMLSNGWISGPNSELIFWVPHRNRDALLIPSMIHKLGVPIPTKLIFSEFYHGISWKKCLTQN